MSRVLPHVRQCLLFQLLTDSSLLHILLQFHSSSRRVPINKVCSLGTSVGHGTYYNRCNTRFVIAWDLEKLYL